MANQPKKLIHCIRCRRAFLVSGYSGYSRTCCLCSMKHWAMYLWWLAQRGKGKPTTHLVSRTPTLPTLNLND